MSNTGTPETGNESATPLDDENPNEWNIEEPQEISETIPEDHDAGIDPEAKAAEDDDVPEDGKEAPEQEQEESEKLAKTATDDMLVELPDGTKMTIADLKGNGLRLQDYSRKMAEVKNVTSVVHQQREAAQQTAARLSAVTEKFGEYLTAMVPPRPDMSMLNSGDPNDARAYAAAIQQREAVISMLNDMLAFKEDVDTAENEITQAQADAIRFEEDQHLAMKLPELANEKARNKFYADHRKIAVDELGFTSDEIDATADHRIWYALRLVKEALDNRRALKSAKAKVAPSASLKNAPKAKPASPGLSPQEKISISESRRQGFFPG